MNKHLATLAIALIAGAFSAGAVVTLFSARADQSERVVPTAGIFTGPQYAQKIGDMARSISTRNKGSSSPANVGGVAVDGLEWLDDSSSPWVEKVYVNGGWAPVRAYDPSSSSHIGFLGGGLGTIASASTTDLASALQANVQITGAITIASFGSAAPAGAIKIIRFAAALTLTWSSALPVPCGFDLVTAVGDRAVVTHLGAGVWEFTSFTRASGVPVDCSAVGKADFVFGDVPPLHLSGYGQAVARSSYPALTAKLSRAQNGTRTSGNATIASVANTAGFGAGMPVEGTGINAGCTIASVVANTSITLNSSSCVTSSGTSAVTVFHSGFGYGSGGSSSTIGVPDCRGRAFAGRDHNLPGSLANRLTSTYFGADSSIFGVSGASSESVTMAAGNLISHLHAVFLNDPGHFHSTESNSGMFSSNFSGSQDYQIVAGGKAMTDMTLLSTGSKVTGMTVRDTTGGGGTANQTAPAGSGSPTPMRTVMPVVIAECAVRTTP